MNVGRSFHVALFWKRPASVVTVVLIKTQLLRLVEDIESLTQFARSVFERTTT
jgi:hypothetical protein